MHAKAIKKRKERNERKGKTERERMKRKEDWTLEASGREDRGRRLVKRGTELLDSVV